MGTFAPADKLQIKLRSLTEAQTILQRQVDPPTTDDLIAAAKKIEAYYLEADASVDLSGLPPKKN